MEVGSVLLDVLIVLIAAKVAAEVAERVGLPAVVGEILAGILIGPSALGLVGGRDDVLRVLGEIGVILLLLEVGLQMDVAELGSVGRAACLVAVVGVVAPFGLGYLAALGLGEGGNAALFLGAALTATSVGITARVFGDLRALARVEARTVLGAAVVDDVLGLIILTVVVRIVTQGSVSAVSVAGVIGLALAFLAVTGVVGVRVGPWLFSIIHRLSRSAGTLVALALAFTLGVAELASAARLAPIVGAFVAGLSLARWSHAERVRRELTPVGHLFIPVFFLQIGIDARIGQFVKPSVLLLASVLLAVAVGGKLVSPLGAIGCPGDKVLIGLGMLPRGEVGLIFAGLGLREGVLGPDAYAALLAVVLLSTLIAPPLLRRRLLRLRAEVAQPVRAARPPEGWLRVEDGAVELNASPPPDHLTLRLALEAAVATARGRPGSRLLDWLSTIDGTPLRWDPEATKLLFRVLGEGNVRSWRLLEAAGVLDRALPELGEAIRRRRADPFELDPTNVLRWSLVERIRELAAEDPVARAEYGQLAHPEWLLLAALVLETTGENESVEAARALAKRLDLGAAAEQEIALLVGESMLLRSAAGRPDGLSEEAVLPIALHLGTPERARALYLLNLAVDDMEPQTRGQVDELYRLVQAALARTDLTGRPVRNLMERRRAQAIRLVGEGTVAAERVEKAPVRYVLAQEAAAIARQCRLIDPVPGRGEVRVSVSPAVDPASGAEGSWSVEVVSPDRKGLLAAVSGVVAEGEHDIRQAVLATWPDGAALESYLVAGPRPPSAEELQAELRAAFRRPLVAPAVPDAVLSFDDQSSPWSTICEVRAPDRPGLLHAIAVAFASAGASVHTASVDTVGGEAVDRFELTDEAGEKLPQAMQAAIRRNLSDGGGTRNGWRRKKSAKGQKAGINPRHSGDPAEISSS